MSQRQKPLSKIVDRSTITNNNDPHLKFNIQPMTFSFSRSAKNGLLALALIGLLIPNATLAYEGADQGKITIRVTDETGSTIAGNWYLYNGISEKNPLVRNGAKGENFTFPAGTYFFEAQPASSVRPYRLIRSENPQRLLAGGSITFSVQYFKTEEQKKAAIANSTSGTSAEPQPIVPATVTEPEPIPPVILPAVSPALSAPKPTRTPLTSAESYPPITAPSTPESAADTPAGNQAMSLAVTGPAMATPALLAFSILLSALVLRKKNA